MSTKNNAVANAQVVYAIISSLIFGFYGYHLSNELEAEAITVDQVQYTQAIEHLQIREETWMQQLVHACSLQENDYQNINKSYFQNEARSLIKERKQLQQLSSSLYQYLYRPERPEAHMLRAYQTDRGWDQFAFLTPLDSPFYNHYLDGSYQAAVSFLRSTSPGISMSTLIWAVYFMIGLFLWRQLNKTEEQSKKGEIKSYHLEDFYNSITEDKMLYLFFRTLLQGSTVILFYGLMNQISNMIIYYF